MKIIRSIISSFKANFLDRFYLLLKNISFRSRVGNNLFFKLDSLRFPNQEFFGSETRDLQPILRNSQDLFENNLNLIKKFDKNFTLENKKVLEIGPGDNFLLDFIFLLSGSKKIYLVDRFKSTIRKSFNIMLFKQYIDKIYKPDYFYDLKNFVELSKRIVYFHNTPFESFNELEENSIDLITSHDVLEHIFNLESVIKNISMLLKKGGYTIHQIDLRDHLYLEEKFHLDFLKYSPRFWKCFGHITNRFRYSYYINLFKKYDLEIIHLKHTKTGPLSKIKKIKKDFHRDYRDLSDEELSIIRFEILAKK